MSQSCLKPALPIHVLLCGPSGSGKSAYLTWLRNRHPDFCFLGKGSIETTVTLGGRDYRFSFQEVNVLNGIEEMPELILLFYHSYETTKIYLNQWYSSCLKKAPCALFFQKVS